MICKALLLLLLVGCAVGAGNGVCTTVSIVMVNVIEWKSLAACKVIDGSVVLSMMDMSSDLSFPELREIGGYLVLYRLKNLTTLATVFPKLTVIRGLTTHENYALVLFDLPDLQDLALPSLRRISRGGVRVENAPKLCYYKSVDWKSILHPQYKVLFNNVPDLMLCSNVCPGELRWIERRSKYQYSSDCDNEHCWNQNVCQSICDPACGDSGCLMNDTSTCCNSSCYGGCFNSVNDCAACKGLLKGSECVRSCPKDEVSYNNWRCIEEAKCTSRSVQNKGPSHSSMKLFNGTCVESCPTGYQISGDHCVKCADVSNCTKKCEGKLVHSSEDLEALKGCTSIKQLIFSLSDKIPNMEKKLEETFRNLTEIVNFLMVISSRNLKSLSFLSNLRVIHGKHMLSKIKADQVPTIKIEHTDFLQSLWNTTGGRRVLVPRGKVNFYMNRRLCYSKIQHFVNHTLDLKEKVNVKNDLSPKTNGDLASCINQTFDIIVGLTYAEGVLLMWPRLAMEDPRYVLGYSIYYRLVGPTEVAQYADPSTCEIRQWQTQFVTCKNAIAASGPGSATAGAPTKCHLGSSCTCVGDCRNEIEAPKCSFSLEKLQPASRYALFVMPQIVAEKQQKLASKSKIIYTKTLPMQPSPPHEFEGEPFARDEIQLRWKPPLTPNGKVTHYLLWVKPIPSKRESYQLLDYCETESRRNVVEPLVPSGGVGGDVGGAKPSDGQSPAPTLANSTFSCRRDCNCDKKPDLKVREKFIYFEDSLLRMIFKPRPEHGGTNRSISLLMRRPSRNGTRPQRPARSDWLSASPPELPALTTKPAPTRAATTTAKKAACQGQECPHSLVKNLEVPIDARRLVPGYISVNGSTEYVVTNLKHFTYYELTLVACLDEFIHPQYRETLQICSNPARLLRRTKAHPRADRIPRDSLRVQLSGTSGADIQLLWKAPLDPNGAVTSYQVQYKRQNQHSWQYHCVSYQEWLNRGQKRRGRLPRRPRGGNFSAALSISHGGTTLKGLGVGKYRLRVRPVSLSSEGAWTAMVVISIHPKQSSVAAEMAPMIVILTFALCLLVGVVVAGVTWCNRKREKTIVNENPDYWSYTYEPDEWEVPRDQVIYSTGNVLGTGSFGCVYKGTVLSLNTPAAKHLGCNEDVPVAVKNVNEKASMRERHEFLQEATHMKKFRHSAHVVRLIGVVSENVPILVLMELMENGDLKNCLRQMRPDSDDAVKRPPPDRATLVMWCAQIADGMLYLENKKYIHRDLAARNCMVTAEYCVKIGDFGMTRDVYYSDYYKKSSEKAPLPIRWMAPESLRDGLFTTASDVWSYGVVLWEIATLASQPFMSRSNEEVLNLVKSGKTLEVPDDCEEFMSELMAMCWTQKPRLRASFEEILRYLDVLGLPESFRKVSWYHDETSDPAMSASLHERPASAEKPPEELPMLSQWAPNTYVHLRA